LIIVVVLWLALRIRNFIAVYLITPGLLYQFLFLLGLVILGLTAPTRTISGLARLAYAEIGSSIASISQKVLPAWVSRAIVVAVLFPVTSAWMLSALAIWELVRKYRQGVHEVTEKASKSVQRALLAADNANGHTREARGFEVQAMQIAAATDDDDDDSDSKAVFNAAKKVTLSVQQMVADLPLVHHRVEKVKQLADKARLLAEEGDFELAAMVAVNAEKAADQLIEAEKQLSEKSESARQRIWRFSVGENLVRRV
jgi:hypothetical protein